MLAAHVVLDGTIGPPLPGVTEVEVGGRVNLYAPATAQAVLLNDTASDVWRLVDGTSTGRDIVALLAGSYRVPAASIEADVLAALRRFVEAGLIAEPGSASARAQG